MRLITSAAILAAAATAAPQPQQVEFLDDSSVIDVPKAGLDNGGFFSHPMMSMGDFFSGMFGGIHDFFGGGSMFGENENVEKVNETSGVMDDGTTYTSSVHHIKNEAGEVVGHVSRTSMNLMGLGSPPSNTENSAKPSGRGLFGGLLDSLYEIFEDSNGPDFSHYEEEYYGENDEDYDDDAESGDFDDVDVEYTDDGSEEDYDDDVDDDEDYEDGEEIDNIEEDEDDYDDDEEIDNIDEDDEEIDNIEEDDEDDYEDGEEVDDIDEDEDYTDDELTVQKPVFDVRSLFSSSPSKMKYERPSFGKQRW